MDLCSLISLLGRFFCCLGSCFGTWLIWSSESNFQAIRGQNSLDRHRIAKTSRISNLVRREWHALQDPLNNVISMVLQCLHALESPGCKWVFVVVFVDKAQRWGVLRRLLRVVQRSSVCIRCGRAFWVFDRFGKVNRFYFSTGAPTSRHYKMWKNLIFQEHGKMSKSHQHLVAHQFELFCLRVSTSPLWAHGYLQISKGWPEISSRCSTC